MQTLLKSPREKYTNDIHYRMLVDAMFHYIAAAEFTPSEVREAALLASIKYEELNIHNHFIVKPELEEALATIRKYVTEGL